MSVKRLASAGISVLFDGRQAILRKDQVTATAYLKGSLYALEISVDPPVANACQAETS